MSDEVKRYRNYFGLNEVWDGKYVLYTDYAKLAERVKELEERSLHLALRLDDQTGEKVDALKKRVKELEAVAEAKKECPKCFSFSERIQQIKKIGRVWSKTAVKNGLRIKELEAENAELKKQQNKETNNFANSKECPKSWGY